MMAKKDGGTPQGWAFLVARGRHRGYRSLLVPDFLAEVNQSGTLTDAVSGDVASSAPRIRTIKTSAAGAITAVYRIQRLTYADLTQGSVTIDDAGGGHAPDEVVTDEHGRPLDLLFGFVVRNKRISEVQEADLTVARNEAMGAYRRFLVDEARFSPEVSRAFSLRSMVGRPESRIRRPPRDVYVGYDSRARNDDPAPPFTPSTAAGPGRTEIMGHIPSRPGFEGNARVAPPAASIKMRGRLGGLMAVAATLLLLAGTLLYLGFTGHSSRCASGALTIEGSTTFAPTLSTIRDAYVKSCPGGTIQVKAIGSLAGLQDLQNAVVGKRGDLSSRIVMSDGAAPAQFGDLSGTPIGVLIFAVVVNKATNVTTLSVADLRGIWQGRYTNWSQFHGADLPISIVGRGPESGTRRTFEASILGGAQEQAFSSNDCVHKNLNPSASVILCEEGTAADELNKVGTVPGAIGYAEVSAKVTSPNVNIILLNGHAPDVQSVRDGTYPYWTVEYLYTYGPAPSTSLRSAFMSYLQTDAAKNLLRANRVTPCVDRSLLCRL